MALSALILSLAAPLPQTQYPGPVCPQDPLPANTYDWSDYVVPAQGNLLLNDSVVHIKAGDTVYFDEALSDKWRLIWIEGRLIFHPCEGDLELRAASILIDDGGAFQIGSSILEYPNLATVTLIYDVNTLPPGSGDWSTDLSGVNVAYRTPLEDRGFVVAGGALRLFGKSKDVSWSKLGASVLANATSMPEPVGSDWEVGDEILLTPTDFDHLGGEVRTLTAGANLNWTTGLANLHYADAVPQDFKPVGGTGDWELTEQGEVANLTRNVVIRGANDQSDNFGHVMIRDSVAGTKPIARVNWAQFSDLGNAGALGRYPFHLHQAGELDPLNPSSFIKNSVIRESANKGIVVHNTENFGVYRNVIHNHAEYGIYLEGTAVNNTVTENLSHGGVKANDCCLQGRVSAGLTMRMPNNTVEDNVAAGYHDYGFYLIPPEMVDTGGFVPFKGNEAHSINTIGIFQNTNAKTPNVVYEDLVAWKCRRFGAWIRSRSNYTVKDSKFADCRGGFYPASTGIRDAGDGHQLVENCLFIGESGNVGPKDSNKLWEDIAGRSLPQAAPFFNDPLHDLEWDVLCGIEVYDGFVEVKDCRFAEFEDDSWGAAGDRTAAAFTQVAKYSTWSVDPRNSVESLQFANVDHNAYFRDALDGENQISFTSIVDKDGSLGFSQGQPARLYPNEDFLMEATTATPNWDANLNGYGELLSGASWGQIVFAPIPPSPGFSNSDKPAIDIVRIDDPGGTPTTSPYTYSSITVPLSPIEGGNEKPRYPINLPVQQVADVQGTNTEKRYYEISYGADYLALPTLPTDFTLSLRFTESVGDAVFFEIPIHSPNLPSVVALNQQGVIQESSLNNLLSSTSLVSAWYWDVAGPTIYLRIVSNINQGQSLHPEGTEVEIQVDGQ